MRTGYEIDFWTVEYVRRTWDPKKGIPYVFVSEVQPDFRFYKPEVSNDNQPIRNVPEKG